jgi:hypothetical protein
MFANRERIYANPVYSFLHRRFLIYEVVMMLVKPCREGSVLLQGYAQ